MPKHEHEFADDEQTNQVQEPVDEDGPIWVNTVTEDSARAFVKQLQIQSRKDLSAPIIIYIDSLGGDAYSLLTMIGAMECIPNQIITCAMGKAMSAGAILLACGDVRYASQHATIMVHEATAMIGGHIDDMNIQHSNLTKLNEKLMKLLVKKCDFRGGVSALKKQLANSRDWYLDAEEAAKFGLIHHVGVPTLYKNLSMQYLLSSNPRGNNDQGSGKKAKD
jgi:ATP-dependent Clp protease protease subunit